MDNWIPAFAGYSQKSRHKPNIINILLYCKIYPFCLEEHLRELVAQV